MTGPAPADALPAFAREIQARKWERRYMLTIGAVLFLLSVAGSVTEQLATSPWLRFWADMTRFVTTPLALLAVMRASESRGWIDGVRRCNTWWKEATKCL